MSLFSLLMTSFSWKKQRRPMLCLAPMAGYADSAFRQIVKMLAPESIVFSEMASSDGLKFNSRTNLKLLQFNPLEQPFIVQLFGKKPENFAAAAKIVAEQGAAGIDINMGCPAPKVVRSGHGSMLMKNSTLAAEIVSAVKKVVKIPLSVKTRLGWDNADNLISFCQNLEQAGADLITVHGRTYQQGFTDVANWEPIYGLKKALKIPVIGNGDIKSTEDARNKLQNLDGIMVGRATFGNPWLMQQIAADFYQQKKLPIAPASDTPEFLPYWRENVKPLILQHCELIVSTKGERIGIKEMRKHLAVYVKGLPNASALRQKLVLVETVSDVQEILDSFSSVIPAKAGISRNGN